MKVCNTCKHATKIPPELEALFSDLLVLFQHKYHCTVFDVVKLYNQNTQAQMFDCVFYEPTT